MPGGKAPAEGEVFANPALAHTLDRLAVGGRDAFYRGEIARRIAQYSAASGADLTFEDLAAHRSEWVQPISMKYQGINLHEIPPNGQGLAAALAGRGHQVQVAEVRRYFL